MCSSVKRITQSNKNIALLCPRHMLIMAYTIHPNIQCFTMFSLWVLRRRLLCRQCFWADKVCPIQRQAERQLSPLFWTNSNKCCMCRSERRQAQKSVRWTRVPWECENVSGKPVAFSFFLFFLLQKQYCDVNQNNNKKLTAVIEKELVW